MKGVLLAAVAMTLLGSASGPEYSIEAIRYADSPVGLNATQIDYSDYRDVGGIKFPFQYKFSWLDGRDNYKLTDVKVNVPIDDSRFGKPSMGSAQ